METIQLDGIDFIFKLKGPLPNAKPITSANSERPDQPTDMIGRV